MRLRSSGVKMFVVSVAYFLLVGSAFARDPFPTPKGLESAVSFWIKVFTKFKRGQAVIHDTDDLELIYDVVDLDPKGREGSERARWRAARKARDRYAALFRQWARTSPNPNSLSPQERHIYHALRRRNYSFSQAARNVRAQQGLREKFLEGYIRAGKYQDQMKRIFREYRLPEDLTHLPHVESSFNYQAYSKFGAAGIWQFTRSTGRLFLTINYDIDERRDPILSTHAAAKLLRQNYETLGSWPLAITAYNHGRAGMQRAVRITGTTDLPTIIRKYNGRVFGFASKNFYAEFLAARHAAHHAEKLFGRIRRMKPEKHDLFHLPHYVSLETLTRTLKLDAEDLVASNPALRPPVIRGERRVPKGYPLRIPAVQAEQIHHRYALLSDSLKYDAQRRLRWYKVTRGDSLGGIARRFGLSVRSLAAANDIRNPALIRIGAILTIPGARTGGTAVARRQDTEKEEKAPPAETPKPKETVVVARGDSLAEIADRFDLSVQDLAETNDIENPDLIRIGAALDIPGARPQSDEREKTIVVARGDSLDKIARRFNLSVRDLAEANGIRNPALIRIGTTLTIPGARTGGTAEKPKEPVVVAAAEPAPSPEKTEPTDEATAANNSPPPLQPATQKVSLRGGSLSSDTGDGRPEWRELSEIHITGRSRKLGWTRVEPEETLGHFADWLRVYPRTLRKLNGIRRGGALRLGQRIHLTFRRVSPEDFEQSRLAYHKGLEDDFFDNFEVTQTFVHTIKQGENFWSLVHDTYEVPFWLMARYNPRLIQTGVHIGDKVIIPEIGPKGEAPQKQ